MQEHEVLQAAQSRLLSFCSLINENYKIPKHIALIASKLEAVERGEIKRLIITVPPRHGKSMLTSNYFPSWYIGRNPEKYIITSTYGQDLSDDFGRKIRENVNNPLFKATFPNCSLKNDSQAASRMESTKGGLFYGVGVGGPITGRGAHLLLIDDPVKNREEADSETMRRKIWDWYRSTGYTRLMPGGAVVLIMTRWHEKDLVGMILENHAHEGWEVINLQAVDEEKRESLWPESYTFEDMMRIKLTMTNEGDEYDWHCLYQQDPVPKQGIIFKAQWMPSGTADEYAECFMAVDPAISKKDEADETAVSVFGIGYEEKPIYYETETQHGRWDFEEQLKVVRALYQIHKPIWIGVEGDRGGKILVEFLAKEGLPAVELPAVNDKVLRAMSVSHLFSQGRVRINTPEVRKQLLSFRGADERNDCADSVIHCLRMIRDYSDERYIRPAKEEKLNSHQWFLKMSSQQEREAEQNTTTHSFDRAYGGPVNQEYY